MVTTIPVRTSPERLGALLGVLRMRCVAATIDERFAAAPRKRTSSLASYVHKDGHREATTSNASETDLAASVLALVLDEIRFRAGVSREAGLRLAFMSIHRRLPALLLAIGFGCTSTSRAPADGPGATPPDPTTDATRSRGMLKFLYAREDNPHFGKIEYLDAAPSGSGWNVRTRSERWFVGHAPLDGGESGSSRTVSCTPWTEASKELQLLLDAHTANPDAGAVVAQFRAENSRMKGEPKENACD